MDKLEEIIKELRVDWESVLSDTFNPLSMALRISTSATFAAEFRDMFHQLEIAMETIIAANYKGFSNSVLCYSEFNTGNKKALSSLKQVNQTAEDMRAQKLKITNITKEKDLSEYYSTKYEICQRILRVKSIMESMGEDLLANSHAVVMALDVVDDPRLLRIKAVDEYRKIVCMAYQKITSEVNAKLLDFIFDGKLENLFYFQCVAVLGSLYELERGIQACFEARCAAALDKLVTGDFLSGDLGIEAICQAVARKVEEIKENLNTILLQTRKYFKISPATGAYEIMYEKSQPHFFGDKVPFKFCADGDFVEQEVGKQLIAFCNRHSARPFSAKPVFALENIVDETDYSKIYDGNLPIAAHLFSSDTRNFNALTKSMEITICPNMAAALSKHICDLYLKNSIKKYILESYTKESLERDQVRVDRLLGMPLKTAHVAKQLDWHAEIQGMFKEEHAAAQEELRTHFAKCFILAIKQLDVFTSELVVENESITVSDTEFSELLISKYINKKDLLNSRERHRLVIAVMNTLRELAISLRSDALAAFYQHYLSTYRKQVHIEFFYFYDLMYRQGNYSYYMRSIVRMLTIIYEEAETTAYFDGLYDNIEYYSIRNVSALKVRSKRDLAHFVDNLRTLDEIMGEIKFHSSLHKLYRFYDEAMDGTSNDKYGKMLQRKIST